MSVTYKQRITEKLTAALSPLHLEVINESHMHNVPPNSETHFKVVIVSAAFEGQRLLGRHRAVNTCLAAELAGGVHALTMHTYTQDEWAALDTVPSSPKCHG
ncbi:BolA family protein [Shewanella salipaludis]|uniref:DNA-binding transcriptional regulator BolA n=1 Tax=Shewanella salipaludis TaxID=2723052 RepID=A0A972FVS4_9GAMM|nr:BolA/IbaG family iron-sulfur metabolism protein [Shewanella salipaludis]NMH66993.1 BolA/IbaG family iron-sulfur metabolism protein [Shewanella salipaludis]